MQSLPHVAELEKVQQQVQQIAEEQVKQVEKQVKQVEKQVKQVEKQVEERLEEKIEEMEARMIAEISAYSNTVSNNITTIQHEIDRIHDIIENPAPTNLEIAEEIAEKIAEYNISNTSNTPNELTTIFNDAVDTKHAKYNIYQESDTFWGIGIENESYLMYGDLLGADSFLKLQERRERYSQNYFKNFKSDLLRETLNAVHGCKNMTYPIYINSHTFQKTDSYQNHATIYDEYSTPNPKFTESIHEMLLKKSAFYKATYNKSIVFDGDSIEFITQQFYKTTVIKCVEELIAMKQAFLSTVSPYLRWPTLRFPDHNYGLVSFLSTYKRNLSLCNNGTYHINLTMPTRVVDGVIVDKDAFLKDHLKLVKCIQMVEPLLVACYGTPDIFSVLDERYSLGSLRVTMSRYISLQTFDADQAISGKLLLMPRKLDSRLWYNVKDEAYEINSEIGYDINFNKFKNHGVELRIFDWFPEKYLEGVVNFLILLAERSTVIDVFDKSRYQSIILGCVRKGFKYVLSMEECNVILGDLQLATIFCDMTAHTLLQYISDTLYEMYRNGPIASCMSPGMRRPELVNYNKIAYEQLRGDLFGKK